MRNYQELKKKYNELIPQVLKNNQSILIESFIEYYLKYNRKIIEQRYNDIIFVYYLNIEYIESAIEEFLKTVDDKGRYEELVNFYQTYYNKKTLLKKMKKVIY